MRTNQKFIAGVFLCLLTVTTATSTQAAIKVTVKVGATCPKAGKIAVAGKSTFICTLKSKKLVWVLKPKAPAIVYIQLNYGSDLHGSITGLQSQKIEIGTTGSAVTAVPIAGYEFASWSDGNTSATRSDSPKEESTFVASFKQSLFTVSYSADSNGTITGQLTQSVAKGTQSTSVTAKPDDGYVFDGWSDGNANPTRTDLATSGQSFSAHFKALIPVPTIAGHTIGTMLWSDEFNNSSSTPIDSKTWTARNCGAAATNGGSTCVTGEVQRYAPSAVKLDGSGNLAITATHTTTNLPADAGSCGAWSGTCDFVSGRLDTQGKVSFQYGYIEAKIKMPAGSGNWPAFWMLGTNITTIGWPLSGEIDIVEVSGKDPLYSHGSLNYQSNNNTPTYVTNSKSVGSNLSDGFHTYGVAWLPNQINFYIDGILYGSQTPQTINSTHWSFNAPYFILLNNAIGAQNPNAYYGGTWDGWASSTMSIDYVRSWQLDGQGSITKP